METTPVKSWTEYLASQGIRFAAVPTAQMFKETGYLTSKIYRENKNPFGMKYSNRGYAKGIRNGHAWYDSMNDAIKDYKAWQDDRIKAFEAKYHPITSNEEYINMLDSVVIGGRDYRYAEDLDYTNSLRSKYVPEVIKFNY